jgi:hypothetical protein
MGNKKPVRSTALELTLRISARGPKEITAVEHFVPIRQLNFASQKDSVVLKAVIACLRRQQISKRAIGLSSLGWICV